MKLFFSRLLVAAALLVVGSCAMAQEGSSADELIRTSLEGLRQIDEDRTGELWNAASAFVKNKFSEAEFVDSVRRSRQIVGVVVQRNWASVTRIRYLDDSAGIPPGLYANVDFATRVSNDKTVFEKVSFRLEPSGWRLTGYVLRETQ